MHEMMKDLFAHQAWADAEHWRALEASPRALDDVRRRLHHIVTVQRSFLALWRAEPFGGAALDEALSPAELKDAARGYHDEAAVFLAGLAPERLSDEIVVPWFENPPCRITLAQAMQQVVMHSQYHRAQNANRVRELGGKPPNTDLIVWYWKGRPAPRW
jgi:uncharacterized damage-inducible protein DinB